MRHDKIHIEVVVLEQGELRVELNTWLMSLFSERRYELTVRQTYNQPVANNRNHINAQFKAGTADFLVMIDDDMLIKTDILSLCERDLDVVGFPAPVFRLQNPKDAPISWNIWMEDTAGRRIDGSIDAASSNLVQVAGVGAGAIMIARRVLEHPDMRAPFMDEWDADGFRTRSEDVAFCYRARAAGFKVWAAMGHLTGHAKVMDLMTVLELTESAKAKAAGPFVAPLDAFKSKTLVFCVSPGRCGTRWLSAALNAIPSVTAKHEPAPEFHHVLREVQHDPGEAVRFWLERKLPQIALETDTVYVETSHLFNQGFAKALLSIGITPRVAIIRRPHREVALSMWRREAIPGRTKLGVMYHVQPDDPGVEIPCENWRDWTDYQGCYWYCLEMEARAVKLAQTFRQRGGLVYETTMAEMVTAPGLVALCEALRLPAPVEMPGPKNANSQRVAGKMPDENMSQAEQQVLGTLHIDTRLPGTEERNG